MIDIKLIDGWYIVTLPKMVLALSKVELIRALKMGKRLKRRQALQERLAPDEAAMRQDPPSPAAGRQS